MASALLLCEKKRMANNENPVCYICLEDASPLVRCSGCALEAHENCLYTQCIVEKYGSLANAVEAATPDAPPPFCPYKHRFFDNNGNGVTHRIQIRDGIVFSKSAPEAMARCLGHAFLLVLFLWGCFGEHGDNNDDNMYKSTMMFAFTTILTTCEMLEKPKPLEQFIDLRHAAWLYFISPILLHYYTLYRGWTSIGIAFVIMRFLYKRQPDSAKRWAIRIAFITVCLDVLSIFIPFIPTAMRLCLVVSALGYNSLAQLECIRLDLRVNAIRLV
jgi:hypothetical protein